MEAQMPLRVFAIGKLCDFYVLSHLRLKQHLSRRTCCHRICRIPCSMVEEMARVLGLYLRHVWPRFGDFLHPPIIMAKREIMSSLSLPNHGPLLCEVSQDVLSRQGRFVRSPFDQCFGFEILGCDSHDQTT